MFVENKYVGVYVKIIFAFVITLLDFLLKNCTDTLGYLWLSSQTIHATHSLIGLLRELNLNEQPGGKTSFAETK